MTFRSHLKPLRVRPGARFQCFGDGLCCSDVHQVGPLSDEEVKLLRGFHEGLVQISGDDAILATKVDGTCMFLGEGRCELHASLGPKVKPRACQHFPFSFVATPIGGRVATDHRCPCRTLGDRPEISVARLEEELGDEVRPNRRVESGVRIRPGDDPIDMESYEEIEGPMLVALAAGRPVDEVLQAEPFFGAEAVAWHTLLDELCEGTDQSRHGVAVREFARTGQALFGLERDPPEELVWRVAFDRAQARSPEAGDPDAIFIDWVSDQLWSLEWAFISCFDQGRVDIVTRLAIARALAARLHREGFRADRAAAEAVSAAELAGMCDEWTEFVKRLQV